VEPWVHFFEVFTAINMVDWPADTFSLLKKPPALPFAAFHHPPWDYSIVIALRLEHRAEGVAFIAASYPSNWPFGGGIFSAVYAWLDFQKTS
jgi:hypothetical protein